MIVGLLEGAALEKLRTALNEPGTHRVRLMLDDGVKFKVNEDMWTAPLGTLQ